MSLWFEEYHLWSSLSDKMTHFTTSQQITSHVGVCDVTRVYVTWHVCMWRDTWVYVTRHVYMWRDTCLCDMIPVYVTTKTPALFVTFRLTARGWHVSVSTQISFGTCHCAIFFTLRIRGNYPSANIITIYIYCHVIILINVYIRERTN